jgi:hypothetical protein
MCLRTAGGWRACCPRCASWKIWTSPAAACLVRSFPPDTASPGFLLLPNVAAGVQCPLPCHPPAFQCCRAACGPALSPGLRPQAKPRPAVALQSCRLRSPPSLPSQPSGEPLPAPRGVPGGRRSTYSPLARVCAFFPHTPTPAASLTASLCASLLPPLQALHPTRPDTLCLDTDSCQSPPALLCRLESAFCTTPWSPSEADAHLAPLARLPALAVLDLSENELPAVPAPVATLSGLDTVRRRWCAASDACGGPATWCTPALCSSSLLARLPKELTPQPTLSGCSPTHPSRCSSALPAPPRCSSSWG